MNNEELKVGDLVENPSAPWTGLVGVVLALDTSDVDLWGSPDEETTYWARVRWLRSYSLVRWQLCDRLVKVSR